ncbi:hypothetical protein QBC42DRAFT_183564 [Cladorrhinum samala]|uniref:GAT domain-containing protein n=1 Tax=Cladorrhinum samala TaxID=585594 RepID=A0AAV9HIA2_9PEZI|nr:hypothetical protein QBC42DRAFT_183564 [Cladorrhinum samala]
MKGFNMNKVLGTIKKRNSERRISKSSSDNPTLSVDPQNDTPESIAHRCVKSFCESRGSASGDDVVFLPAIVEAAVASPAAATECARLIRKFMGRDYWTKPSYQYNAIMLIRILCDNPGPNFTRNMDKKFVDTTKELLRSGRDVSVRQMLMETLDTFENTRGYDEGLDMIIDMWKKEKEKAYKAYGVSSFLFYPSKNFADFGVKLPKLGAQGAYQQGPYQPQPDQHGHGSYHRSRSGGNRLPDPIELANRLEEARTSASLLEQVVANTPPSEVLSNDLIKEFADRCSGASKSIQGYMSATNPAPDNDTMESMIDTNEQLQQALNHHHRAVLQAKKHLGIGQTGDNDRSSTSLPQITQQQSSSQPVSPLEYRPPVPRKVIGSGQGGNGGSGSGSGSSSSKGKKATTSSGLDAYHAAAVAGPSSSRRHSSDSSSNDDPFRDPAPEPASSSSRAGGSSGAADGPPRLSYEPYHPGFMGDSSSKPRKAEALAEPVTPVSDDEYEEDLRRARQAAAAGGGDAVSSVAPTQDPGPVYRY